MEDKNWKTTTSFSKYWRQNKKEKKKALFRKKET